MKSIVFGPDDRLSTPCTECGDEDVSEIVHDLVEFATANENKCAGLAANQLGHTKRVCVVMWGGAFIPFVDPVIIKTRGKKDTVEGCLSWPERAFKRTRAAIVVVASRDRPNIKLRDQAAVCIQHEIDHLDGKEI